MNRASEFLSSFRTGIGAEKHHLILPDYYRSRESTEHKSRTSQIYDKLKREIEDVLQTGTTRIERESELD